MENPFENSFKQLKLDNNESKTDIVLANSIDRLVSLFEKTTEFSNRELKAISILQTNKYYANLIRFYIDNKKHLKRKFVKEILQALKEIGSMISKEREPENERTLLDKLLHRD